MIRAEGFSWDGEVSSAATPPEALGRTYRFDKTFRLTGHRLDLARTSSSSPRDRHFVDLGQVLLAVAAIDVLVLHDQDH
jgi:hypothetical protein